MNAACKAKLSELPPQIGDQTKHGSGKLTGRAGMKIFTYSWVRLGDTSVTCEPATGAAASIACIASIERINQHETLQETLKQG